MPELPGGPSEAATTGWPVWICREATCPHYRIAGMAICSDLGHQTPEQFVNEAWCRADQTRRILIALEEWNRRTATEHVYARDLDPAFFIGREFGGKDA
jgi:hypothetical protein